ncbi:MAG: hypothetical protein KZQ89_21480 [Candidatus Thiodiazotropha sp. (ex Lucinoma kastoroae)]|nr:hypothetical protein [Candidatus Thiodiazotropha sp. (ex Lucinoma kastoroae)]
MRCLSIFSFVEGFFFILFKPISSAAGHGERTRWPVVPGSPEAILETRRALRQRGSKDRIRSGRVVISGAGSEACIERSDVVA